MSQIPISIRRLWSLSLPFRIPTASFSLLLIATTACLHAHISSKSSSDFLSATPTPNFISSTHFVHSHKTQHTSSTCFQHPSYTMLVLRAFISSYKHRVLSSLLSMISLSTDQKLPLISPAQIPVPMPHRFPSTRPIRCHCRCLTVFLGYFWRRRRL